MLDFDKLDKETQDRLSLKEQSDPTFENALTEDYTNVLFQTLKQRSNPMVQHSYIATIHGQQGSGKSYAGLSMCGVLDPKLNIDKIYFDIERLVNDRKKLKSNTTVIVDEMTRLFGTDSVRISIMINAIKEQLRKKSIHMVYCSPTLKTDEYHTSMYVLESMFIDKKERLSYFAYKTNELLTLGYVSIPHPLNFINKNLLIAYEEKKDVHLASLLEGGVDAIEDRAKQIVNNPIFQKAEKVYLDARGYIPYKILVQIIEKIFPEFKGSVIVYEMADRCKANKEISGEWIIFGTKKQ